MEENTFNYHDFGGFNSAPEDNALIRWLFPQVAEESEFKRENYMMDKANAFNEYMYNKANEYNSASSQMQRALEAGINPNLMAAGIAGIGGNQATPPQSAQASMGMNTNTVNPIEAIGGIANTMGTLATAADTAGNLFGFGKKNKAEIELIKTNATKAAEEMKFTRRQRTQLEQIGRILVDNAKLQGKEIEKNLLVLDETIKKLQKEQENIEADTDLKKATQGEIVEKTKTQEYENARLEFEKVFRNLFGIELTHGQMSMLIEACLNGKGEIISNYFIDTISGVIKGIKEKIDNQINESDKPFWKGVRQGMNGTSPQDLNIKKWGKKAAKLEWFMLPLGIKKAYHNDFEFWYRTKYMGASGSW